MTALTQAVLVLSLAVAVALLAFAIRQRPRPGATAFAVYAVGNGLWVGAALGGALTDSLAATMLWTRIEYVGITTVPPAFLLLAARYTGNEDLLTRGRIAALFAVSATAMLAMWTTHLHWLFYTDVHLDGSTLSGIDAGHGPLYFAWVAYGYALVVGGIALLVQMLWRRQELYRNQAAATIVAAIAPLVSNVLYQFDVTASDLTPVAFAVTGVALGWSLYRFEFMDVTPVARKRIVEDIRDGVLVLDDSERIVDANPAARRLLGVPDADTLVGGRAADALHAPFDALHDAFDGVVQGSETLTFDTGHGRRFVEVDVRPYEGADGRTRGRLFYLHDVTDRERRERELRRQNDQLDRFASLVSHDLRNPLNVAEGYVEVAADTGDVSHLDDVDEAHDRMRAIIDDVLDLARHGRTVTEVEPVALDAAAQRAWETVDTDDATLQVTADARVLADESRLLQLLENLFRNSVEHGSTSSRPQADDSVEHGGSGVTVTVGDVDDGFYVADDGPGIPQSERDQVLEDGYTTNPDGTGLGLSIVQSVADAHGWAVSVEESATGGARFAFTGTAFARDDHDPELFAD
jgi:PAS domain S-box-containing protein